MWNDQRAFFHGAGSKLQNLGHQGMGEIMVKDTDGMVPGRKDLDDW
jgi:hypothetical protein